MTYEEALFEESFYHDFECWFSSDIACCDNCFDDFVSRWPGAYLRDTRFQRQSIQLSDFYSGSRLRQSYTEKEYWNYIKNIKCPECGASLDSIIWPYNLPFEVPQDFEEIAAIARKTPFLVLEHPFAKSVYEIIRESFLDSDNIPAKSTYYRGRYKNEIVELLTTEFEKPPAEKTKEGRYNHAGLPVLYLGSDIKTCHIELRQKESIYVAEIVIKRTLSVLDLNGLYDDFNANEILLALIHSSYLSAPKKYEGWNNPQYVFSRFVADCAKSAGYDAIKYPTTKSSKGHNLVILDAVCPLTDYADIKNVYLIDDSSEVIPVDFKVSTPVLEPENS